MRIQTLSIDLAADGQITKAKIHAKPCEIARARSTLQAQLDDVNDDLSAGENFINECLKLLARLEELYAQASNETRRKLNQAIFKRLFVMNDEVVGDEMVAPLGELLAAQTGFEAAEVGLDREAVLHMAHAAIREHDPKIARAARNNQTSWQTVDDLLTAIDRGDGSSKPSTVPLEGFEPPTVSLGRNCSSVELQRLTQKV